LGQARLLRPEPQATAMPLLTGLGWAMGMARNMALLTELDSDQT